MTRLHLPDTLPNTERSVALHAKHGIMRRLDTAMLLFVPQQSVLAMELEPDRPHPAYAYLGLGLEWSRREMDTLTTVMDHRMRRWRYLHQDHRSTGIRWYAISVHSAYTMSARLETPQHTIYPSGDYAAEHGVNFGYNGWFHRLYAVSPEQRP